MTPPPPIPKTRPARRSAGFVALSAGVATLGIVGWFSPYALVSLLVDGLPALLMLGVFGLGGLGLLPSPLARELPMRWRCLLGFALGTGAASLLVLALGLMGLLQRPLVLGVMITSAAVGALRLKSWPLISGEHREATAPRAKGGAALAWLWMLLVPFGVMAILSAASAPGMLWSEEGFGYDVLEYHLEMPKEYWQQGRIAYAPHNVYASFPAAVEMHYLLAMVLLEDALDTGAVAHFIHALFGVLTVFAAWCIARDWSRPAGLVAALAVGTANWLWYLSGLAYVELGLLFYAMTATGLLLRWPGMKCHVTTLIVAGVVCGFACGCKYPAVVLVAIPLSAACLMISDGRTAQRVRSAAVFAMAAGLAFSPWMIKNAVATGNPFFPLVDSVFHARPTGWDDESAERWSRGHEPAPELRSLAGRIGAAWDHIAADTSQRFGPMLLAWGLAGLWRRRRDASDRALVLISAMQMALWLTCTHLYARFAIVLLVPLALLAGRSVLRCGTPRDMLMRDGLSGHGLTGVVLLAGAAWNLAFAVPMMRDECPLGMPASVIREGRVPGYDYLGVINRELPPEASILLVGDARAFYLERPVDYRVVFNRNPFVQAVRSARRAPEIMAWLERGGYTHVLVHWSEINRLKRSRYGFPEEINEDLFNRLTDTALRPALRAHTTFAHPTSGADYATLYELIP